MAKQGFLNFCAVFVGLDYSIKKGKIFFKGRASASEFFSNASASDYIVKKEQIYFKWY